MTDISSKILCTDNHVSVARSLCLGLDPQFEIVSYKSVKEALDKLRNQGPFAVIIADRTLPDMDVSTFVDRAQETAPDAALIFVTDSPELNMLGENVMQNALVSFIKQTCLQNELQKSVREAFEQYRLSATDRALADELNKAHQELSIFSDDREAQAESRPITVRQLHQFVSELHNLDTLEEVADHIVHTVADMLQSRRVSLMMPEYKNNNLQIVSAVGIPQEISRKVSVPIGAPIAGRVFSQAKCIVVNDESELPFQDPRYDTEFFVSMPLMSMAVDSYDGPIGVLNVTEKTDGEKYDEVSVAILTAIGEAATIALMNQIRHQERDEARYATIMALAKLAEHRDPETGAHLERVQSYCELLSETMAQMSQFSSAIDRKFIEAIVRSSPLHDIGKVGVPDHILLKKGPLTDQETEIMKRHTIIGGDTIKALIEQGRNQHYLQMGMDIAYNHHEKFDGSGYPAGLSGNAIPLSARILSVADVYDALTSKRSYKRIYSHQESLAIIGEQNGTRFDPLVIEAFMKIRGDFRKLSIELSDDNKKAEMGSSDGDADGLQITASEQVADNI